MRLSESILLDRYYESTFFVFGERRMDFLLWELVPLKGFELVCFGAFHQ